MLALSIIYQRQMSAAPLCIKLRCASWAQLSSIHRRDLARGALFLKSGTPPPLGTRIKVDLALPSGTVISLTGAVAIHIPAGDPSGRGPGVDVALDAIDPNAQWIIDNALSSAQRVREPTPVSSIEEHQPSVQEGVAVSNAEQELLRALTEEMNSLRRLNPFQVLGVGYESGDTEIRAAFAELTKRYHPDRFARYESEPLRKLAAEIFILIRDAYRKLSDVNTRAATLGMLGHAPVTPRVAPAPRAAVAVPVPPVPQRPSRPVLSTSVPEPPRAIVSERPEPRPVASHEVRARIAEQNAQAWDAPSNRGFRPPETERKPISAPPPQLQGDAPRDFAAIEAMLDEGRVSDALAAYKVITKINPADRTARAGIELCEGMRALAERDRLKAAQRFELVLEIDPSNERAARELAEMRRMATNERKGLLAKLMNKKD